MKLFPSTNVTPKRVNLTSSLDDPEAWFLDAMLGKAAPSGVRVTQLTALGVATVYACTNLIARTIATLPLSLYQRDGKGKREATEHPLFDLLKHSPNEEMTTGDFRLAMQGHLSLRNNSFAEIKRSRLGSVGAIWPIHPAEVRPDRDRGGKLHYVIQGRNSIPARNMLHLRGLTSTGIQGMDLISTVGDVFGLAIALEENAMKFFANSSRPSMVLEAPNRLSDPAYERLKEDIENKQEGLDNVYKAMILEEGLKAANIRTDNRDSQFDESRDRQDRQIARVFGVPPHKVGVMNSEPRANVEEQNIEFATDTIGGSVGLWEQHMNWRLLTDEERSEGYFFKYNLNGLLRGNVKDRSAFYVAMLEHGVFSIDDVRGLEDKNPLPEGLGEVHTVQKNMQILSPELIEGMKKAAEMLGEKPDIPTPDPDLDGGSISPNGTNRLNGKHNVGTISL